MSTDLGVRVEDSPGGLADVGEAVGNAGINIEGLCGVGLGDRGLIHVLVEDGPAARAALEGAGLSIESEDDAIVSEIPAGAADSPGVMGQMARAVAQAGVNIGAVCMQSHQPAGGGEDNTRQGARGPRNVVRSARAAAGSACVRRIDGAWRPW